MASPKSSASDSAASSPEEFSEVKVIDSYEPLVTACSSVPRSAQVIDSSEPLVPTVSARVQVLDSNEPLVLPSSSSLAARGAADPGSVAGPSGTAGPSGLAAADMVDLVMPASLSSDSEMPTSGSFGRRINPYADELRSMWNWRKVFSRLGTDAQCLEFAEERELLPMMKECSYHHTLMSITRTAGQVGKLRCRKSNCRSNSISRATGTWFENVLPLNTVFGIMYGFSEGLSYEQVRKQVASDENPVLSTRTVADWFNYCRETIVIYELENQGTQSKIGGPGKIVQIDESKFGKRKYNRGRHIEGHWVIGMIEDGSDDLRLEVCPDSEWSAEVLVPLIQ